MTIGLHATPYSVELKDMPLFNAPSIRIEDSVLACVAGHDDVWLPPGSKIIEAYVSQTVR